SHSSLRRRVGADAGQRIRGTATRKLDDLAMPLRLEVWQHGPHRDDGAEKVDLDGADPFGPVGILEQTEWAVDAGIVDQDMEASGLVDALPHGRVARRSVGHVGQPPAYYLVLAGKPAQLATGPLECGRLTRAHHD